VAETVSPVAMVREIRTLVGTEAPARRRAENAGAHTHRQS